VSYKRFAARTWHYYTWSSYVSIVTRLRNFITFAAGNHSLQWVVVDINPIPQIIRISKRSWLIKSRENLLIGWPITWVSEGYVLFAVWP